MIVETATVKENIKEESLEEFLYDAHYQWIKRDKNKAVFGLTPEGLEITGDILYLSLPPIGSEVCCGQTCGSLEAGKWVGRIYSPLSGKVARINSDIILNPGLINERPYQQGFMEIELSNPAELQNLMSQDAFSSYLAKEAEKND